ncbi:peptidase S14 [Mesorhizobium sp. Cs1299R1N3]|uniref:peptidase S14 n=1 Tax=Mesorhizobium sp. Cs1299R1N3 TaxID=3015173 RepID=UPI00301DDAD6
MTTIVYRDGVMAADSRAYAGDKHPIGTKSKLRRLSDGSLLGVSASIPGLPESFRRAVEKTGVEADLEAEFDCKALLVKPDGTVWFYNNGPGFTGPLKGEFFSTGSGEQYAYAAMVMGADAVRAVEVAIECDAWTKAEICRLTLLD